MATATTITHKVRNPIYDKDHYPSLEEKRWLDIWSANISSNGTYTITLSNNWSIPGDKILFTPAPANSNVLIQADSNGKLTNGPQINSSGSLTKLLNEKGEWVEIGRNGPIIFDTSSTSKIIIEHATSSDNWPSNSNLFYLKLNGDNYWPGSPESTSSSAKSFLIVNKYGHVERATDISIPLASSNYAGLVPKFTNNATDENKILKIVRNNNNNSIVWVDSADLKNNIPVVTASDNGLTPNYGSNANGKILSIDGNIPTWIEPTDSVNGGIPTATSTNNGLIPKSGGGARKILYTDTNGNPVWTASGSSGQILKISDNETNPTLSWVTPKVTLVTDSITHVDLNIDGNALSTENNTISAGRLSIPSIEWVTGAKLEYQ